ncbi:hypothetical protein [Caulobacter vibrioides]|uniref:hypothetical protein n=1 Tax=Caulobacter vibrioides TaxID=155892 RepID=UPI000BB4BFE1|nr:hypothetical protein [Caulobacter vibrioides]ATC25183.1 hypothetical protein CA608_11925 [Caulobacter vibrioides]PLR13954.1 hypothetical protein CVUC_05230 [Caulobacter vibrioides]
MPPTKSPPIGARPLPRIIPAARLAEAIRTTQQAKAHIRANQRRLGTALDALNFAMDKIDDTAERSRFLDDWRCGDLGAWPDYRPPQPQPPALNAHGYLLRSSALLAGFFAGLMLLADLIDAATRGGDPIRILLTCSWGAAVLICAGAAWAAPMKRGEG